MSLRKRSGQWGLRITELAAARWAPKSGLGTVESLGLVNPGACSDAPLLLSSGAQRAVVHCTEYPEYGVENKYVLFSTAIHFYTVSTFYKKKASRVWGTSWISMQMHDACTPAHDGKELGRGSSWAQCTGDGTLLSGVDHTAYNTLLIYGDNILHRTWIG